MQISIEVEIEAQLKDVWNAWGTPDDITQWNFATDEWCCPRAAIDLQLGGNFNYRMEARDAAMGFDFEGEFTTVDQYKTIQYKLADKPEVTVDFIRTENGTKVVETFGAEDE